MLNSDTIYAHIWHHFQLNTTWLMRSLQQKAPHNKRNDQYINSQAYSQRQKVLDVDSKHKETKRSSILQSFFTFIFLLISCFFLLESRPELLKIGVSRNNVQSLFQQRRDQLRTKSVSPNRSKLFN